MYSIYFNNRCIAVCSKHEQSLLDQNSVLFLPGTTEEFPKQSGPPAHADTSVHSGTHEHADTGLHKGLPALSDLPAFFQSSPQLTKLYVPTNNVEDTFNNLCTKLTSIQAGGGLVTNCRNEYLLIFRHGVWDLPKGKQESGEEIRQAALREVEEECGVHDLEIKEHICDTYHTYMLNDNFMLKCTHWYKMEYHGNGFDTLPQMEENIEKAVWIKKEDLPKYLKDTYPSIKEVFRIHDGQ